MSNRRRRMIDHALRFCKCNEPLITPHRRWPGAPVMSRRADPRPRDGDIEDSDRAADFLHAVQARFTSRKIDRARCADRSARDRAGPMDSPDDWAYPDKPAAPDTARRTG